MADQPSLIPGVSAVVEEKVFTLTAIWYRWLYSLWARVITCAARVATVRLAAQAAAIATASAYAINTTGLYRISAYLRVTQAASASSSATVTLGWRDTSTTLSQASAAVTGNTTTTAQGSTLLVRADAGTTLTYAVAYVSVGATAMQFAIDVVVEQVP